MKNGTRKTLKPKTYFPPIAIGACVGTALLANPASVFAQAESGNTVRMERLEKENADLKARLDSLEALAVKEGLKPSDNSPKLVKAMSEIQLSGFVQASYFVNTDHPKDGLSDAYLWNTKDNSFSLNKFKLTAASKPVASDKWDAGFKASLIFGEDAPQLNTPGNNSSFNDVREAYVELNVPIGTGLNIKVGELISLLNYESGDGGAANVNFSQGNQWWFTGNGPSAGVQATYNFTDKVGLTLRADNGLFQGPVDNNEGKAFSASLNLKPTSNFWVNIYPFYDDQPGHTETKGVGTIGGVQITEKLGTGFELDYFNFDGPGGSSDLWSVGGWVWYDFTPKVGIAFRADYIDSPDGVLGPAVRPGAGITTPDSDGNLASLTLTLNWKPVPNVKIQPEIRWDTTSYKNGLDGHQDRFTVGAGISYLF
jgi:hypothetical protein